MRKPTRFDREIFIRGTTYWYRGTPVGTKRREEFSLGLRVGEVTQKEVLLEKKNRLESLEQRGSKRESRYESVYPKYLAEREGEEPSFKTLFEIKSVLGLEYTARQKDSNDNLVVFRGKYLGPFLRGKKIHEIDQDLFDEYCKLHTGITLHNHVKVLNAFLGWCARRKYKKFHVEIKLPKSAQKDRRQRKILSDEQIKELISRLDGRALVYHAMYLTLGIRNKEILRLKWEDVSFENRSIRIHFMSNKNKLPRVIPANSFVLRLLAALERHDSPWVFPSRTDKSKHRHTTSSFRDEFRAALSSNIDESNFTQHDLRATFEKFMHINPAFTDTQREKMAGAKIDVQKNVYVTMLAEDLRGLEDSVQIEGLNELFNDKILEICGAKRGAKSGNQNDET